MHRKKKVYKEQENGNWCQSLAEFDFNDAELMPQVNESVFRDLFANLIAPQPVESNQFWLTKMPSFTCLLSFEFWP